MLWSPRVGFNWDVAGKQRTQVRGGTGVFTGPPLYVWISNQIGNTGVLIGEISCIQPTATRASTRSTRIRIATSRRTSPAAGREQLRAERHRPGLQVPAGLAQQHRRRSPAARRHDGDRRVPLQQGRQRHLLHQRQPAGGADRRSPASTTGHAGRRTGINNTSPQHHHQRDRDEEPERRPVVEPVRRACRRRSTTDSPSAAPTATARRKNTIDPGSTAFSSVANNQISGDPNNPGVGVSRLLAGSSRVRAGARTRSSYFDFGTTTVSAFWEARPAAQNFATKVELRVRRRHERRRLLRQRPDLHPARHVGDELRRRSRRQRPHVHRRRAGGGLRGLHPAGRVPEQAPRPVRRARRAVACRCSTEWT